MLVFGMMKLELEPGLERRRMLVGRKKMVKGRSRLRSRVGSMLKEVEMCFLEDDQKCCALKSLTHARHPQGGLTLT